MNKKWSLDSLYKSFEGKEYREDKKILGDIITEISKWKAPKTEREAIIVKKIVNFIEIYELYGNTFFKLYSYAQLTMSVDARNERAVKEVDILENMVTKIPGAMTIFYKWVAGIKNLEQYVKENEELEEYSFFISECVRKSKYMLSEKEEVLFATMKTTGSTSWAKLQEHLTSVVPVEIVRDGKKESLPLPVVRNLAYNEDSAVRELAYKAELAHYEKIQDSVAFSLNGIKGEVINTAKIRKYESPLDMTLENSRMDKATLDAMLTAMKEYLPEFRKYFKKKAELLGKKNGLPFYDMFAPMGASNRKFTYEEAGDYIVKNFGTFSDKLANFARKAIDNGWIDVEPREGKRGGAFCENLHCIGESRIMTNFDGSFNQMITLSHELGHGYHGECLTEAKLLNADYPMPLAETASIFCETIVKNAAIKESNKEEAFAILEQELQDCSQVIVDILSRYLFETKVMQKRENGPLSADEFKEIMINAQKEAYGDGLDPEKLHPYMWVCKGHYYSADFNFYNFPYAFGLLFAKGLYAEYLKKGDEFVEAYDKLLLATGKNNIADVAATMGIDVRNPDFWRSSLKIIAGDIDKFCKK